MSNILRCILVLLITAAVRPASAADEAQPVVPDLSAFPTIEGQVVQVLGHTNSYVPPRVGDRLTLDLSRVSELKMLGFTPADGGPGAGAPYVPLASGADGVAPLTVESVKGYGSGVLKNLRLVSRSSIAHSPSVKIDIVPLPGAGGPRFVRVWVLIESDVVHGVVLVEGQADGDFPGRNP